MSNVVEAKVTRRNFNRARFGTKPTLEALVLSGWSRVDAEDGTPRLTRNGRTIHPPSHGCTGVEWTWAGARFALVPDDTVVLLPGASGA